jgi:hypothetical protein
MQPLTIELTLATGVVRFPRNWDETDVPAVSPRDLAAAVRLCLSPGGRVREGTPVAALDAIGQTEQRVLALFSEDPARALAVLLRLRSVLSALQSRRFRQLADGRDPAGLLRLVVAAAGLRLNAGRGLSPVRLAWVCVDCAAKNPTTDDMPAGIAA